MLAEVAGWIGQGSGDRVNRLLTYLDRGEYFQIALTIRERLGCPLARRGLSSFRQGIVELAHWLADRVETIGSLDEVKLLTVKLNRLKRWYTEGLLYIGNAAHAMSPVAGVGVNLAVQALLHAYAIGPTVNGTARTTGHGRPAWPRRLLAHLPGLRSVPGYLIAVGFRLEHAPAVARR